MKQINPLKKYVNRIIDWVLLPTLTVGSLVVSPAFGFLQPPRNLAQLEEVLEEEKEKLGIEDNIELIIGETPFNTFAEIELIANEYGEITGYKITLDEMRNRFAIRHELYHKFDEHLVDYPGFNLKGEVQANVYALTGLRF